MCKSLNLMEQEFQSQLMKHAGALLKLMNKLQDVIHCSLDLREVIEKATHDILYCEKVKKTWRPLETDEPTTEKVKKTDAETQTPDKPPAPKKLKKSMKKPVKLNTDFNNDQSTIIPPLI